MSLIPKSTENDGFRYCRDHDGNDYVAISDLRKFLEEDFVEILESVSDENIELVINEFLALLDEGAKTSYENRLV